MLTRSAVVAHQGMVASSQPLAVSAGLWVLRSGGNFADAAIATSAVLTVVEPWASQLGGDAFMVVYDARTRKTTAINGSGAAPRQATRDRFPNGFSVRGLPSATVPGLVDAWFTFHKRYGSLPFNRLLEPAIEYAKNGFPISPRKAQIWRGTRNDPNLTRVLPAILHRDTPPTAGTVVKYPDLAWTLQQIASGGRDAFYKGEVAQRILRYSREHGGLFEAEDFAQPQSEVLEPIRVEYRGYTVHGQPPVSQGMILLEALSLIEGYEIGKIELPDRLHVMVEAIKGAFADRWKYLGDPRRVKNPVDKLLSKNYAESRRKAIRMDATQPVPEAGSFDEHDTTYFCVADSQGNAVSFIQSLYHYFGCGVVAEGTGVMFNNRMLGFTLNPDSPNVLEPGKRPIHTLNAYLITKGDELAWVGGTPGGDVQVQSNLQIISQVIDFQRDPQAAIEQPRWAWQPRSSTEPSPGSLLVEIPTEGADEWQKAVEELKRRGHAVNPASIGGHPSAVQLIQVRGKTYFGGSDPRTEGMAGGY